MVTGQNHTFVQHNRLTFAGLFHFGVTRNTARSGSRLVNVGIHQTEFQRCGRTENLFRTRGVLDTRQFNHDTVSTLTLYQRLGHAQLVYTVTQNVDVLLNGIFTRFFQTRIGHHRAQLVAVLRGDYQVTVTLGQVIYSLIARRTVAERDAHAVVIFFTHGGVSDAFITQIAAQAVDILFLQLAERGIHIHFHQEVNATTQVKTEFHWLCIHRSQPTRGCRGKVKRHDVFITQHAHQRFTCAELRVGGVEASKNCALFQCHRLSGNFFFL